MLHVIFLILIASISGLSSLARAADPPLPPPAEEGIAYYFQAAGNSRGAPVIRLPAGTVLSGTLGISSGESKPLPVRLVCLLDWRQVPFRLDGRSGNGFDLRVPPGSVWTSYQIELPAAAEGTHELMLGIFLLPETHLTMMEFRRDSSSFFEPLRHRVVWGAESAPSPAASAAVGEDDELARRGGRLFSLVPGMDPDGQWEDPVPPGGSFVVHLNNGDSKREVEFALLAFLDFEQVPVLADQPVVYRRLRPQSKTSVKGVLPEVEGPGPHEFLVLLVEDPHHATGMRKFEDAHSSRRVLLQKR